MTNHRFPRIQPQELKIGAQTLTSCHYHEHSNIPRGQWDTEDGVRSDSFYPQVSGETRRGEVLIKKKKKKKTGS